jgi:hypothetical protein
MDLLPRWFQDGYTVHSSQYTGVGRWGEKLRLSAGAIVILLDFFVNLGCQCFSCSVDTALSNKTCHQFYFCIF